MFRPLTLVSLLAFFGLASWLAANDGNWQTILQYDNDLLTGTDEGYTNGARIAFTRELPVDSAEHNFLQSTLRKLTGTDQSGSFSDFRFPEAKAHRFQYGIGLSQLMFTPDDSDALTAPAGERPYAGWLGLEFSLQASAGDSASTATLSIGTTGQPSYARDMQKWVHQNISDSPVFQGWDSQSPAELTINLHLDHKRRIQFLDSTRNWPIQLDGFTEWGGSLGNFRTDAYLGALFRAGLNLPSNYTSPRVQLGSFTDTIFEQGRIASSQWSLYSFAGVRGYAVLHDISLDGPVFRDWAESVDSKPWVGELSFGLAARYERLEISLAHTLRSDEFDGQSNRSRYGSVLLRVGSNF